ncbi:hypothetical protein COU80_02370 [Candidatus Peregrinibacteria bacterium CG10_big_fil_rev_8_21_14_0_10_55_24]|nr:MAG: hypothetical protein COU80_02370 [Candidatus Peregrinibacteria bacterium CG10_big_fil_rev_8_21_14_0_10_55_24]
MYCHIDADAFFASVLQRHNPRLRGKPLLALAMGGGFVIAASYEAKAKGVKTGMRLRDAQTLCPEALAAPSDFSEACSASQQIESILMSICPRIEKMSVDEWFLDLKKCPGGVPHHLLRWARGTQRIVSQSVGVSVSVGIAPTKLLAKMASEYRKPSGITMIDERKTDMSVESFLRDRPKEAIPGMGRQRSIQAQALQWRTAWDVAQAPEETLVHLFGKPGITMRHELMGTAVEEIEEDVRPPQSISRCRSFTRTRNRDMLMGFLMQHAAHCVLKMRREGLQCRGIAVWLRDAALQYAERACKLPQPLDTEEQLLSSVHACFCDAWNRSVAYTQIGMCLFRLQPAGAQQYALFENTQRTDRAQELQRSLDTVRKRYGRDAIVRGPGVLLHKGCRTVTPNRYGSIPTVR